MNNEKFRDVKKNHWEDFHGFPLCYGRFPRLCLIHFKPVIHFYTPRKLRKQATIKSFSGVIEVEHWLKMG